MESKAIQVVRALKADDFLSDYQINVLGAVQSLQACLPALKKADNGAGVVFFSTVAVNNAQQSLAVE